MQEQSRITQFEQKVLPHLDAAYNLACRLTRDETNAEDVVQEAYLRAFKFFDGFHGTNCRAWLMTIVRNTCYTWLRQTHAHELAIEFNEELHSVEGTNPEMILLENVDKQLLKKALEELPVEFREVMILRELEGFSYIEIAAIASVPIGTVMSRLARARKRLQICLTNHLQGDLN